MAATTETSELFARGPDGKLTATGQAERWTMEFHTARERLKKWQHQGEKILDRYLDERSAADAGESRLNLFTANVETQHSMLYGKVPGADVSRHFEDSADDVARVAAEMLERLLTPLSSNDPYVVALSYALEDRLLPGFGFASVRYEVETEAAEDEAGEPLMDEAGQPVERKAHETVETEYRYWKSVLWSPCRTFEDSRWFAWCVPMTREAAVKRFGDIGKEIPLNTKTGKKGEQDAIRSDPWSRSDVWEIWSKEDRAVYWYVEGYPRVLDQKDDPLGLEGFYPFPKPMVARATTRNFLPRPDFVISQDLYNEIDVLTTRINLLEKAVRVAGVYDKSSPEVAKLLVDAGFNKLYPGENWALHAEKGGLKGVVDWFPLEQVTNAIGVLTEKRAEKIGLLQQVSGWSDIMRGQSNASETLGAQQLKAQYGSVRIQRFQNEFARFATDLQRIRAEIICKHFDIETIIERSNVMRTKDAEDKPHPMTGQPIPGSGKAFVMQAAQLLKDEHSKFRVEVKPENINLTDYALLKQERTEVLGALGGLIAAMTPLIQAAGPAAAEFTLAAGAWLLAGTKGGDSLEAEFDQFRTKITSASSAPRPPAPPDPKVIKAQIDLKTAQTRGQAEQVKAKTDMAATVMDAQIKTAEHGMEMQRLQTQAEIDRAKAENQIAVAQATPPPAAGGPT